MPVIKLYIYEELNEATNTRDDVDIQYDVKFAKQVLLHLYALQFSSIKDDIPDPF